MPVLKEVSEKKKTKTKTKEMFALIFSKQGKLIHLLYTTLKVKLGPNQRGQLF